MKLTEDTMLNVTKEKTEPPLQGRAEPYIFTKEGEEIPEQAKQQMRGIYNIRPTYVNGMYITPVQQQNNYLVRITYSEFNYTINETIPVSAVILSLDDFINNYKLMTEYLNKLKEQGVLQ